MDGSALIVASAWWLAFQGLVACGAAVLAIRRARTTDAGLAVVFLGLALVAATGAAQEIWYGALHAALPRVTGANLVLLLLKAGHWIGLTLEIAGLLAGLLSLQRRHAYLLAAAFGAAGTVAFGVAVATFT